MKIPKEWVDYPILERCLAVLLDELRRRKEASLSVVEIAERVQEDRRLVLKQLRQGLGLKLVKPLGVQRKGVTGIWTLTWKGAAYFFMSEARFAILENRLPYFMKKPAVFKVLEELRAPPFAKDLWALG